MRLSIVKILTLLVLILIPASIAFSHGVDENTKIFLSQNQGEAIGPFLYIGAKHMLSGYDHLLFLFGVIFFLYSSRDIVLYVSLFTLGHSLTLFFGVLENITINPYFIDAVIGLSIVYKGFDNLGGFQRFFGFRPNTKIAVFVFGLFHGFGLATKLHDFELPKLELWKNLLAFNIGVEIGQCLALLLILIVLNCWRRFNSFYRFSVITNTAIITGGWILFGYQIAAYLVK